MSDEIKRLVADLGKVPVELRRELRPAVRRAAQPVLEEARRRASWSSRIPGATKISARFSGRRAGVSIVVSAAQAPHGRPYEHMGAPGTFRHPVFGNRDRWVPQSARPFLFPAARAKAEAAANEIDRAVVEVLRRTGFN